MGAHVRGNLEEAIAMSQRIEAYRGGNSKTKGQAVKRFQKNKKGLVSQVQVQPSGETPRLMRFTHNRKRNKGRGKEQIAEGKAQTSEIPLLWSKSFNERLSRAQGRDG